MWLVNEIVHDFSTDKVSQSSIQSDNSIKSYRIYGLQTDTFVKTVFSNSEGVSKRKDLMKISKVIFLIKPSHLQ